MKDERIQIRLAKAEKTTLAEVSAFVDVPASQFIREAIKEKVEKLKTENPKLNEVLKQAA